MHICVYCHKPLEAGEVHRGAGDGTGQRFAHDACWKIHNGHPPNPEVHGWDEPRNYLPPRHPLGEERHHTRFVPEVKVHRIEITDEQLMIMGLALGIAMGHLGPGNTTKDIRDLWNNIGDQCK